MGQTIKKELTDFDSSVSSLSMNHKKCCQIVAAEGLNPSKPQSYQAFPGL